MSLAIRLALHGCANRPFYHIVVMQTHRARNSRAIEQLGTFDPMPNKHDEKLVALNFDRLKFWIAHGAELTQPVGKLLGLSGYLPIHPMTYITAKRNRERAAAELAQKETQSTETSSDDNS
ncbi:hypothetical protein NP493_2013g00007 [Ridgeia piscesae]|uniref:Small ribosomal subunit protein bS16m n=1 Tax=Ridgeia piscesae TaxID=27915 RepID=A0AAD9N3K6_RIDPI|nr:hypothetical protein NP493_2013g00007 [Ridgeia piscesae]